MSAYNLNSSPASNTRRGWKSYAVAAVAVVGAVALTVGITIGNRPSSTASNEAHTISGTSNFMSFLEDKSTHDMLVMQVPESSLNKPFITHAIFNKGTVIDGETPSFYVMNNMPAEDTQHTVFHFELTSDGKQMNYVREQWVLRTSNGENEYALEHGAWVGSEATMDILSESTINGNTVYEFDATALAVNAFFVSSNMNKGTMRLELPQSKSFANNMNMVVNYDLPMGLFTEEREFYSLFFTLSKLPESQMVARRFDDRVGYFTTAYTDLGVHGGLYDAEDPVSGHGRQSDHMDNQVRIINRHRLERDESGNAINPIVYHIDPTIPSIWRPYFKQGVEAWGKAYEAAGFKNAIKAVLPEDPEWPADYHVGDLRYKSISFAIATLPGALAIGPSVVDPRSGEILGADIVFSSTWARVWLSRIERTSPVIPNHKIEKPMSPHKFGHRHACKHHRLDSEMEKLNMLKMMSGYAEGSVSKDILGAGFADVTAHEVGHTLGLRHNFVASTARTVDQLKNVNYTKEHGVASSYMDYAPINIWSGMSKDTSNHNTWFQNVVGEYDLAAIKYGYSVLEGETNDKRHPKLNELARNTPEFATDDDAAVMESPFVKRYDSSSDPAYFHIDRLNLVRELRTTADHRAVLNEESWINSWNAERTFLRLTKNAVEELSQYIGAVHVTHSHRNEKNPHSPSVQYVSKEDQLRAIHAMLMVATGSDNIFPTEYQHYVERVDEYGVKSADVDAEIQALKQFTIESILSEAALLRIVKQVHRAPLSVSELLEIVSNAIVRNPAVANDVVLQMQYAMALNALQASTDPRIVLAAAMQAAKDQEPLPQTPVEAPLPVDDLTPVPEPTTLEDVPVPTPEA